MTSSSHQLLHATGPRWGGALIAALLPTLWLSVAVSFQPGGGFVGPLRTWLPFLGPPVPVVAALGWLMGDRIGSAESVAAPVLLMAVPAVLLSAMVSGILLALPFAEHGVSPLPAGMAYAAIGLVVFGWLGLVVAVPSAYAWAWLMRSVYRPTRGADDNR